MNIDLYTDKEIENLKEQIRFLEVEISLIASEKASVERQIHQYEILYNKELGDLVEKVLEKRKEKLRKEVEKNPAKEREYKEADREYHEFKEANEESKKNTQANLNEDEQIELKTKFRKACMLCHPDKVADEYKEEAQKIFIELREAYDNNNLKRVSEILEQLEKGIFKTGSESITEKEKLLILFNNLKMRLEQLRKEVSELKQTEVYQIIAAAKDFDSHFENLRQQLTAELNN